MDLYDTFEHTVDPKGRLVMPAPFRPAFADGGFLVNMQTALGLFPAAEWEPWVRRVEQSGKVARSNLRFMIASVSPIQPDSQHRISINPRLRQKLHLDRDVAIVGQRKYAQIYDLAEWERFEATVEQPPAERRSLVDELEELDFL